jgi:cobalt-zinc-cadmium efflux system outer membrane protein
LEQTIQIAGKRKKLIGLEQVKQGYALAYFEELLRNVRVELRNMLTELQYLQQFQGVFSRQLPEIQKLMEAYERLSLTGNINRADVVRLKALVLEMMDQQSGLQKQINGIQKELSILLGLEPGVYIQMDTTNFLPSLSEQLVKLDLSELIRRALAERSDIKLSTLELQQAKSALLYEKAVRVPDISLSAGYDRGGNFLYNFWGFGMGIDLPLFNRNQGNIKAAGIGVEKAILLEKEQAQRVKAEVIEAYQNFHSSLQLYRQFEGQFENELDHLLVGYTRNFKERNVSMLEFLDFMDSFLESRKIILNTIRSLHRAVDELEYAVGGRLTAEE